jgi:hypothetical protein
VEKKLVRETRGRWFVKSSMFKKPDLSEGFDEPTQPLDE